MRLEDIPNTLFPEIPDISATYALTYWRIFTQENRPNVAKPFSGVIDTLSTLRSLGYSMAVASSRSHGSLQEFVDNFRLNELFCMVIGGDDVTDAKPTLEPVFTICRNMNWRPDETLVVGDATYDIYLWGAMQVVLHVR